MGKIHFLENTGTPNDPSFEYLDSSFFNIEKDLSTAPAFGDLDGDGDNDLLVGLFSGEIDLYLNSGTPSSPVFTASELLRDINGNIIDAVISSVPFLIDIDNDFDLDLVIGGFSGKFELYLNVGSPQDYSFQKDASYFSAGTTPLDIGDQSTPFLFDYDNNGSLDLFSGSRDGKLYYFKNEGSNQSPVWNQITDLFIDENFGGYSAPHFVDIDDDSDNDLLLGNVKGGLYLYLNSELSIVADWEIKSVDNFTLDSYPNPFNPDVNIMLSTSTGKRITVDIFNILGEKVKSLFNGFISAGVKTIQWNGRNDAGLELPSGTYLVLASSENQNQAIKISFLK
jgi:hypothetical protein